MISLLPLYSIARCDAMMRILLDYFISLPTVPRIGMRGARSTRKMIRAGDMSWLSFSACFAEERGRFDAVCIRSPKIYFEYYFHDREMIDAIEKRQKPRAIYCSRS